MRMVHFKISYTKKPSRVSCHALGTSADFTTRFNIPGLEHYFHAWLRNHSHYALLRYLQPHPPPTHTFHNSGHGSNACIKYTMISSRQPITAFRVAIPSLIKSCALQPNLLWGKPDNCESSAKVVGASQLTAYEQGLVYKLRDWTFPNLVCNLF